MTAATNISSEESSKYSSFVSTDMCQKRLHQKDFYITCIYSTENGENWCMTTKSYSDKFEKS